MNKMRKMLLMCAMGVTMAPPPDRQYINIVKNDNTESQAAAAASSGDNLEAATAVAAEESAEKIEAASALKYALSLLDNPPANLHIATQRFEAAGGTEDEIRQMYAEGYAVKQAARAKIKAAEKIEAASALKKALFLQNKPPKFSDLAIDGYIDQTVNTAIEKFKIAGGTEAEIKQIETEAIAAVKASRPRTDEEERRLSEKIENAYDKSLSQDLLFVPNYNKNF